MQRKTRLLLIGVVIVFPLGLGLWARSAASWRPRKIGTFSNASLIDGGKHGPWLCTRSHIVDLENGNQVTASNGKNDTPLCISPDGLSFAIHGSERDGHSGINEFIEVRESASGKVRRHIDVDCDPLVDIKFSPDDTKLLLLMDEGLATYPLDGSKPNFSPLPVMEVARCISMDGQWIGAESAPYGKKRSLKVYQAKNGRLNRILTHVRDRAMSLAFSPDASLLSATDTDGPGNFRGTGLWICNAKSGKRLCDIDSGCNYPTSRFSPDNQSLLVFDDEVGDSHFELYSARTGELLNTIKLAHPLRQIAFSSDSTAVYALDRRNTLWKIRVR